MANPFLSGAIMMGYLAIGYFFFRFWRKTSDRFFAIFATAFYVLAIERIVLLLTSPDSELRPFVYLVRLLAFLLIIYGIYDKNRPART